MSISFRSDLERLLQGDLPQEATREIRALLEQERFQRQEGLTSEESAKLSYQRARFLANTLRIGAKELRDDPRRLYALHESVPLIDSVAGTVLSIHYCLALGSLLVHGRDRPELNDFVAELERMDSVGVFLATELGHGNDVAALETEAVYHPERREFRLTSPTPTSCKFMPNTGLAVPRLAVVMARLISLGEDHGVFPFLVRIRGRDGAPCPGIRIASLAEKPGYALDNAMTAFDDVHVPKAHLLEGEGSVLHDDGRFESRIPSHRQRFLAAMDRVQTGRVCFTSGAAAVARAATWIAMRYTSQRLSSALGKRRVPLLAYRNVQRDVFGALATTYALTFAVRFLQKKFSERTPENEQEIFRITATLKAVVTAEVGEILPRLRERCGAVGMLSQNHILEYWNQVQGVITAEGDNQLMLLKTGRQLFDTPEPPVPPPPTPPAPGELEPDRALELLHFREARLRKELKASTGEARRRTREPFAIWNANVNLTLALGSAHGARLLAQCFQRAIADCRDATDRQTLSTLCSLWAWGQIDRFSGWFLANGCLTREWVEEAQRTRDRLCAALEPHALAAAEAFGLDNALLRAPIAEDDYVQAYYAKLEAPDGVTRGSGRFRIGETHASGDQAFRRGA
jgi:acyl-CoA oxidase